MIRFSREFYQIAFNLKKGSISPLFFSGEEEGAAYVLRKAEETPGKPMTFEEAAEEIRVVLADQQKMKLAEEKAELSYKRMQDGTLTLESTAENFLKQVQVAKNVGISTYIENVGPAMQIVSRAAGEEPGTVLEPMQIPRGFILVRVDEVVPADLADFEDQNENLYRMATMSQRREILEKWFEENAPEAKLMKNLEEL